MKNLLKMLSVFALIAVALTFTSCDDLFNFMNQNENQDQDQGDPIIHEFYFSQKSGSFYYFTSTNTFEYTTSDGVVYDSSNPCVYQISFNAYATHGTWILYTRPKGSTNTIQQVERGTYQGKISEPGTIELYIDDTLTQTLELVTKSVQLENKTKEDALTFQANVKAAHTIIGASDLK